MNNKNNSFQNRQGISSTLPYNFVPLNDTPIIAKSYPGHNTAFSLDRYYSDRFTGWIDLDIKTLTPLYIRDSVNLDELKKKMSWKAE